MIVVCVGLAGAGKSAASRQLVARCQARGLKTYTLLDYEAFLKDHCSLPRLEGHRRRLSAGLRGCRHLLPLAAAFLRSTSRAEWRTAYERLVNVVLMREWLRSVSRRGEVVILDQYVEVDWGLWVYESPALRQHVDYRHVYGAVYGGLTPCFVYFDIPSQVAAERIERDPSPRPTAHRCERTALIAYLDARRTAVDRIVEVLTAQAGDRLIITHAEQSVDDKVERITRSVIPELATAMCADKAGHGHEAGGTYMGVGLGGGTRVQRRGDPARDAGVRAGADLPVPRGYCR